MQMKLSILSAYKSTRANVILCPQRKRKKKNPADRTSLNFPKVCQ